MLDLKKQIHRQDAQTPPHLQRLVIVADRLKFQITYAPVNGMPHYPYMGPMWGKVGIVPFEFQ